MENECCICLEPYDDDPASSSTPTGVLDDAAAAGSGAGLKSLFGSNTCAHGICVQCAINHIIAYEQDFCPYCRIDGAFSGIGLSAMIAENAIEDAEALMRAAKFTAVKEKIAVPWIYDTMTTLLQGDAYTDDDLPSAKLTSSLHVETRSVDRRANGSIHAEFCLSLIGSEDEGPISSSSRNHDHPCQLVLECTIQPMPSESDDAFLEDNEVMA
jgi:hypothetical protein